MGKGRKRAQKQKELEGSDSDASLSDGELQEKERKEMEKEDAEMKSRLERIKAGYTNKQKTLVLSSRGITYRYRHLMSDVLSMLPHSRKDSKLDTKQKLYVLNEIADMKDCTNCVFFEVRKGQDLYLWFAKVPHGPSIKFHALNVHTMSELNFTGNCLKGSRPFLSFDANFEKEPHTRLMKSLLSQIFGTPKNHPRSRPFIDHVFSFTLIAGQVWFRNYQVAEEMSEATKKIEKTLVEIGPRFVLDPIRILAGGFSGEVLWDNPEFVTPNTVRSLAKKEKSKDYVEKKRAERKREQKRSEMQTEPSELDKVFADTSESEAGSDDDDDDSEGEDGMDVDEQGGSGSDDDDKVVNGMEIDNSDGSDLESYEESDNEDSE